ncbi:hypothetical protein V1521DRAFT_439265 [Lipomyces starkeyi]
MTSLPWCHFYLTLTLLFLPWQDGQYLISRCSRENRRETFYPLCLGPRDGADGTPMGVHHFREDGLAALVEHCYSALNNLSIHRKRQFTITLR